MRLVTPFRESLQSYVDCQGSFVASAMLYVVPKSDSEQYQWGAHPALVVFIDKPALFRYENAGFASSCHNLSFVIVVK